MSTSAIVVIGFVSVNFGVELASTPFLLFFFYFIFLSFLFFLFHRQTLLSGCQLLLPPFLSSLLLSFFIPPPVLSSPELPSPTPLFFHFGQSPASQIRPPPLSAGAAAAVLPHVCSACSHRQPSTALLRPHRRVPLQHLRHLSTVATDYASTPSSLAACMHGSGCMHRCSTSLALPPLHANKPPPSWSRRAAHHHAAVVHRAVGHSTAPPLLPPPLASPSCCTSLTAWPRRDRAVHIHFTSFALPCTRVVVFHYSMPPPRRAMCRNWPRHALEHTGSLHGSCHNRARVQRICSSFSSLQNTQTIMHAKNSCLNGMLGR